MRRFRRKRAGSDVSDPKKIVLEGFDALGERYLEWQREAEEVPRRPYLDRFMSELSEGSRVLVLGCGPGVPATGPGWGELVGEARTGPNTRGKSETPRRYLLDLHLAYHLAGSLIEYELAVSGITAEEYAVYSVLGGETGLTPTELSRQLGLALSSTIFRSGKLIARGHARRFPNPRDRRSALIALTPGGRLALERARPAFERVLDRIERQLDFEPEEVQAVVSTLGDAIAAALSEAQDEALLREKAS
jgi:DNA-binding MarR family transcriptional regulator